MGLLYHALQWPSQIIQSSRMAGRDGEFIVAMLCPCTMLTPVDNGRKENPVLFSTEGKRLQLGRKEKKMPSLSLYYLVLMIAGT